MTGSNGVRQPDEPGRKIEPSSEPRSANSSQAPDREDMAQFHASEVAKRLTPVDAEPRRRRNLLLIARSRKGEHVDHLCSHVREIAPDIDAFYLRDRTRSYLDPALLKCYLRPTLAVSFLKPQRFRPLLNAFCHGRGMCKSEEYRTLEAHDIPVPRWTLLREGEEPCLDDFTDYVVSKPDRGAMGADVCIRRKSRVRWQAPKTDHAAKLQAGSRDFILQEFIYTGRWPVSYRVTSLFGKVLFALRVEADHARRPLEGASAFQGGGISIVANAIGATYTMLNDPEIIRLGERAHAAFPQIPLLGVDIVRDHETGRLYVIEVNSDGWVWHFESKKGRSVQDMWGLDFESQFDGIRKAAYVLAENTRLLAR
jgi:hypothetical protein